MTSSALTAVDSAAVKLPDWFPSDVGEALVWALLIVSVAAFVVTRL